MSKYRVCPVCDGEGTYVNPAIDSHGLSSEELEEDPEFAERYFAGGFDVRCKCCDGRRVVTASELREYRGQLEDFAVTMAESGQGFYMDSRL
jgi:hypothetical protein